MVQHFLMLRDSSSFMSRDFLEITANNLNGDDWFDHCSRPVSEMQSSYEQILDGIELTEFAEIDYIVGNRIHVKVPLTTPLNSNYFVAWQNFHVGMGVEDLHFDGGLDHDYVHIEEQTDMANRAMVTYRMCAHAWVRRCRFSNVTTAGSFKVSYASSFVGNIVDGRFGHYSIQFSGGVTRCFVGLLELHTNRVMRHGVSIHKQSTGNVIWAVSGPKLNGPDTHGAQCRLSLFDNYHATTHDSSSGGG